MSTRVVFWAEKALHHDDPPCSERLRNDGECPLCGFYPDMQSIAFHFYCSRCRSALEQMKCPQCLITYQVDPADRLKAVAGVTSIEIVLPRQLADVLERKAKEQGLSLETFFTQYWHAFSDDCEDSP